MFTDNSSGMSILSHCQMGIAKAERARVGGGGFCFGLGVFLVGWFSFSLPVAIQGVLLVILYCSTLCLFILWNPTLFHGGWLIKGPRQAQSYQQSPTQPPAPGCSWFIAEPTPMFTNLLPCTLFLFAERAEEAQVWSQEIHSTPSHC